MRSVLIVEDDPGVRELQTLALRCGGYEVRVAENGSEALRELEIQPPCVILLDLVMPVMDGLTFLVERQRRGVAANVPVICITGAGNDMILRALELGAKECMPKPADLDAICEKVAYYCEL